MNPINSPTNLTAWIEVATSGLPSTLKIRLKSEIEDHYASLLEKQLAEGQSHRQAETLALQQLGAAASIRNDYRDAHFSRDLYLMAMRAVSALLVIHLINLVTWAISQNMGANPFVYNDQFIAFDKDLLPWNALTSMVSAVLILVIARGIVTLLKERYEVKVSKILYWLFIIGVCCSAVGMTTTIAMDWFTNYMVSNARWGILKVTQETQLWSTVLSGFSAVRGLSPLLSGAALVVFSLTAWKSLHHLANLFVQMMVLMIGATGAAVILNMWITVFVSDVLWTWRAYRYYTPYVLPVLMVLLAVFLVLPFITFRTMRLSGRTLEAGE